MTGYGKVNRTQLNERRPGSRAGSAVVGRERVSLLWLAVSELQTRAGTVHVPSASCAICPGNESLTGNINTAACSSSRIVFAYKGRYQSSQHVYVLWAASQPSPPPSAAP